MSTFLWQAEFNSARAAVGADSPADLRAEVVQTSTKGIQGAVNNAFVFEAQFTQFFNATPKALGLPVQSHVDADGHPQDRCINARLSLHVLSCTARGEGLSGSHFGVSVAMRALLFIVGARDGSAVHSAHALAGRPLKRSGGNPCSATHSCAPSRMPPPPGWRRRAYRFAVLLQSVAGRAAAGGGGAGRVAPAPHCAREACLLGLRGVARPRAFCHGQPARRRAMADGSEKGACLATTSATGDLVARQMRKHEGWGRLLQLYHQHAGAEATLGKELVVLRQKARSLVGEDRQAGQPSPQQAEAVHDAFLQCASAARTELRPGVADSAARACTALVQEEWAALCKRPAREQAARLPRLIDVLAAAGAKIAGPLRQQLEEAFAELAGKTAQSALRAALSAPVEGVAQALQLRRAVRDAANAPRLAYGSFSFVVRIRVTRGDSHNGTPRQWSHRAPSLTSSAVASAVVSQDPFVVASAVASAVVSQAPPLP